MTCSSPPVDATEEELRRWLIICGGSAIVEGLRAQAGAARVLSATASEPEAALMARYADEIQELAFRLDGDCRAVLPDDDQGEDEPE